MKTTLPGGLLGAALALTTLACSTTTSSSTSPDSDPPFGVWELASMMSASGSVLVSEPSRYTIELRDDGTAHVVADCNRCSGPWTLGTTAIELGLMACTRAYCGPDSLHDDFLESLAMVTAWERDEGELVLSSEASVLRFR